jgi:hypothetical protein
MDTEFETLWRAVGWETIDPMDEEGSRLLTIQFLCTLEENVDGISFHLFNQHYDVSWADLYAYIGFNPRRCAISLDFALPAFNRAKFWEVILGRVEAQPFRPLHSQIQHPSLKFMHRWIAMTLFSTSTV